MIQVCDDINILSIATVKYNGMIHCPFQFAKKVKKVMDKYFSNQVYKDFAHSIFPEDKYIRDISDYVYSFLHNPCNTLQILEIRYTDQSRKNKFYFLPYYKRISENIYNIYGINEQEYNKISSCIIKFEDTYISLIRERCLYLSHIIKKNGREFGCLSMCNLFTVESVQSTFCIVRKYMEICNSDFSNSENDEICSDWLQQEITTYIFKIHLLTAETVFAHIDNKKVEKEVGCINKEKEFQKLRKSFLIEIK
jgi:hypothetical protein